MKFNANGPPMSCKLLLPQLLSEWAWTRPQSGLHFAIVLLQKQTLKNGKKNHKIFRIKNLNNCIIKSCKRKK
jgi:hypothetical protein